MKKKSQIFTFLFLAGMLFTVFQYMPFLEEETPGHRVELCKKVKPGDTEGGDNDCMDDDCDDDSESDLNYICTSVFSLFHNELPLGFFGRSDLYGHDLGNIHTPPPRF